MLKMTLIAAALTVAGASAAYAQNGGNTGVGHAPYGYDSGTSALGRYCPPGYYPHSAPTNSGIRCEPPGDTTQYVSPY